MIQIVIPYALFIYLVWFIIRNHYVRGQVEYLNLKPVFIKLFSGLVLSMTILLSVSILNMPYNKVIKSFGTYNSFKVKSVLYLVAAEWTVEVVKPAEIGIIWCIKWNIS